MIMCTYIFRPLRKYITILLLSASIAWGQEEEIHNFAAVSGTCPTDDVTPLQEMLSSSEDPKIKPLTAEQQKWLNNYLAEKCSTKKQIKKYSTKEQKKQIKKLLAVVGHKDTYVREAAL